MSQLRTVLLFVALGSVLAGCGATESAPATANIGEPVDLTVKALSKSGDVVKNYTGIIFIIVNVVIVSVGEANVLDVGRRCVVKIVLGVIDGLIRAPLHN